MLLRPRCRNSSCSRRSPASSGWKRRDPHAALARRAPARRRARRAPRRRRRRVSITGARMNTPGNGPPREPVDVEVGLERVALAAVAVAAHRDVDARRAAAGRGGRRRTSRASTISPAHVPSAGRPSRSALGAAASRSPDESSSLLIVVDSPPGRTSASSAGELLGRAHLDRVDAERVEHLSDARGTRPAARGRRPSWPGGLRDHAAHQPRSASLTSSVSISSPRIASPSPRDTLATMSASA